MCVDLDKTLSQCAMDVASSLLPHPAPYKRRSPPPISQHPCPLPTSSNYLYLNGTASALSFSSRSANSRNSFSTTTSECIPNGTTPADEPGIMSGGESSSAVHASPGVGGYAYSTTLRRQPSLGTETFSTTSLQRSASPHHASPYRKRTASETYSNGRTPLDMEDAPRGQRDGIRGKVSSLARKVMRRKGYEELARGEDDRRASAERRARETPSAIFAHKSIDVSSFTLFFD